MHSDPDQTVGIVQRLPRMPGQLGSNFVGISAPVVSLIELRAALHQELDDVVPALECCPHQRRAAVTIGTVRIQAEIQQHLHGFQVFLR